MMKKMMPAVEEMQGGKKGKKGKKGRRLHGPARHGRHEHGRPQETQDMLGE